MDKSDHMPKHKVRAHETIMDQAHVLDAVHAYAETWISRHDPADVSLYCNLSTKHM